MSTYDDASLVLIPSGYKNGIVFSQKPMDANGQLTFTRASSATRVQSDGLIEKVRTNNILQSNSFDTTWDNVSTSETSGQAGYDGTNNAWLLDSTSGFLRTTGIGVTSGLNTFSVYAKKGTADGVRLRIDAATDANCYIDLNDGSEIIAHTGVYLSVVSVGSGWYRIGLAINDATISNLRIYPIDDTGGETTGNIVIQNSQWEQGDIATDYIPTTTAAVSVGPVSGLPRLDYLNSSCPRLLLEPQRTNNLQFSEQFDNAYWTKTNLSVSANTTDTADPSGYYGADKIIDDSTNGAHQLVRFSIWSATQQTLSIFAKAGTSSKVFIQNGSTGQGAYFDLSTQSIILSSGFTATIESYGNGWFRCIATHTALSSQTLLIGLFTGTSTPAYIGTGSYAYIWGVQIEAGAYATSYIPTLGASVTRVADAAVKTGISSLIGQTEGTLFVEVDYANNGAEQTFISTSDGTLNNRITISYSLSLNVLNAFVRVGGITQALMTSATSPANGIKKIAVSYKLNDYRLYINGTQVAVDSSALVPTCSRIDVGSLLATGNEYSVNQALIFPTALTPAQLAELTSL
jgi:hypothetical protein